MTTFYNAPTVLLLVLCALVVGACFGWLARGSRRPVEQVYKPFKDAQPLKTHVYEKPAAPPKPIWEEDPFFARPETLGDARDGEIEHIKTGNVVSMRPVASGRAMG